MPESYYSMVSREFEQATRPIRAKYRRAKYWLGKAAAATDVYSQAANRMGEAAEQKRPAPNYGAKKK
jgi:hypothetical protein